MTSSGLGRLASMVASGVLCGCASSGANYALGVGSVVTLGHTPTTNIAQTYYLGVFDPRQQLPPTIYRIHVQGQASALSTTSFASGWLRSDLVDSLNGQVSIDKNVVSTSAAQNPVSIDEDNGALNRRMIMFGPEGFRVAPRNHRLVVVMGSKPENFFSSVDRALGVVASVTQRQTSEPDLLRELWADSAHMREERRAMQTLLDLAEKD